MLLRAVQVTMLLNASVLLCAQVLRVWVGGCVVVGVRPYTRTDTDTHTHSCSTSNTVLHVWVSYCTHICVYIYIYMYILYILMDESIYVARNAAHSTPLCTCVHRILRASILRISRARILGVPISALVGLSI
jgi:hypothetical protein